MTRVTRPVHRETDATIRSGGKVRPVVVTLAPPAFLIQFRLKGERRTYELPIQKAFAMAVALRLAEETARKKAERKARKEAV